MASISAITSRSLVRMAPGLPSSADNEYTPYERVGSTHSVVHQQNTNHGRGVFNNVNGTQNFNMNLSVNFHSKTSYNTATISLIEPYRSAIDSLFAIIGLLEGLPQNPSVSMLREEVAGLVPVVICAAKVMEIIRRVSPNVSTHTFFSNMESQALKYGTHLKELKSDINEYIIHLSDIMLSSTVHQIFILVFPPHRWLPLSHRIRHCIRVSQISLEHFLRSLVKPQWRRIVGDEHAELRHLITVAGLATEPSIRDLDVPTIWIRDPAGADFHAMPLSLCASWRDFTLVVHEYFKHGPEGSYIRRGRWEMVHVGDNRVIGESSFRNALKPEAMYDIGILLQLSATSLHTCPQCGHDNSRATVDPWVSCSNPTCGNIFRVELDTTPKPSTKVEALDDAVDAFDSDVPHVSTGCLRNPRTKFRRVSARVRLVLEEEAPEGGKTNRSRSAQSHPPTSLSALLSPTLGDMPSSRSHSRKASLGTMGPSTRRRSLERTVALIEVVLDGQDVPHENDEVDALDSTLPRVRLVGIPAPLKLGDIPSRRGHSRAESLGTTSTSANTRKRSLQRKMALIQGVWDGQDMPQEEDEINALAGNSKTAGEAADGSGNVDPR